MKSVKHISSAIAMLISLVISGQEKTVTGTIFEGESSLPGAAVLIKNTHRGTQTDIDGAFLLKVKPTDTLVVSFIGMKTQFIPVGIQKNIAVKMEESEVVLREVYDDPIPRIRKKEVVSCVTHVNKDAIENPKNKRVAEEQKLIKIQSDTIKKIDFNSVICCFCKKNAPIKVTIYNQYNKAQYILNDTIVSAEFIESLPPDTIESITILKEKDSEAMYGPSGRNGTIIIKTKDIKPTKN